MAYEVPIPQQPLVWMNDGKVPPPEDKLKFEIDTIQAPSLSPLVASVQLMIADIVGQANDVELSDMATLQDVVTQLEAIIYLASQYDSEPSIKPVLDTIEALTIYLNRELQEAEKNLMGTDISSSAEGVRNALLSLSSSLSTLSAEIESASVSVQPATGTKKVPLKDIVSGAF